MAIIISHQPPMDLLARAGYYIGAGEERARQRELEQQERMQIRGIETNLLSQQLSYQQQLQRDAMHQQYDAANSQASFDRQATMQKQQDDLRKHLAQLQREHDIDLAERQMKHQRQQAGARHMDSMQLDQMQYLNGQAEDTLSSIRNLLGQGLEFDTEDELKRYQSVVHQLGVIAKDDTIRPMQKAQAAFELTSRLSIPRKPSQDWEEYVRTSTTKMEDPNNPGQFLLIGRDRSGEPRVLSSPSTDRRTEELQRRLDEQKLKTQQDEADQRLYQDVVKMLTRQETPEGSMNPVNVLPSHEEVQQMMQRIKGANVPPIKVQWDADGNLLTSPQEAAEALRRLSTPGENAPVIWDEGGKQFEPTRDEAIEALRRIVAQGQQQQRQQEKVLRFKYTEDGQLVPIE